MAWIDGINDSGEDYGESPYYSPPDGLEILIDRDFYDEPYEFAQVVVWRDKATGQLLAAADSGCSCPTPFGGLTRDGMKVVESTADLDPLMASVVYSWTTGGTVATTAKADLVAKVHRALADRSEPVAGTHA